MLAFLLSLLLAPLAVVAPHLAPLPAAHRAASLAPPGGWVAPVPGPVVVTRPFAPPPPDQPWDPGHRGVDLALPAGGAVRAAGAGVVTFAGTLAGRGVVVVDHGILRTTYEPVRAAVRRGQPVSAGQLLGWLDPPGGCPVPPCAGVLPNPLPWPDPGLHWGLHWGLLRGHRYLDPLLLLGLVRVRLLPFLGAPVRGP